MFRAAAFTSAIVACAPEDMIKDRLDAVHGEEMRDVQDVGGYPVELWASAETGSWTLFVTADGMACVIGVGAGWNGKPINSSFFPAA